MWYDKNMKKHKLAINWDKQGRHIKGHKNYIPGRSILTADPELLLQLYADEGNGLTTYTGVAKNRERFDHTEVIGIYKSEDGAYRLPTTRGIIHYSKTGAHVIPSRPK